MLKSQTTDSGRSVLITPGDDGGRSQVLLTVLTNDRRLFITLCVQLCVHAARQAIRRDVGRRAGLSASPDADGRCLSVHFNPLMHKVAKMVT